MFEIEFKSLLNTFDVPLSIIIVIIIVLYWLRQSEKMQRDITGGKLDEEFAWVTLVMKGNSYIPGALALAQSLKSVNTKHKIVCMVTEDVTDYKELELLFDEVVQVKYINIQSKSKSKSNERYNEWINQSATKWRCLELVRYKKVMFVDSDVVFLKNFDYIFDNKCPAATFFNGWNDKTVYNNKLDISNDTILHNIKTNYGPLATMILLPTIKDNDFVSWVERMFEVHTESKSTYDEQTIGEYLIYKGFKWHYVDYKYNYMVGKNTLFSNKDDIPYIFHYYNKKPWIFDDNNKIFNNVYWLHLYNSCKDHVKLKKYIDKYKLPKPNEDICPICKFKGKRFNHRLISSSGKISCNLYM